MKDKIDKLCLDAWNLGRVDIKELHLSVEDAYQLDLDVVGDSIDARLFGDHVGSLLNSVTGSAIHIIRLDPFEQFWTAAQFDDPYAGPKYWARKGWNAAKGIK